jgi:hypothetical protein
VLVRPEGGVAHATPANVDKVRSRKPATMMMMRFMWVHPLSVAVVMPVFGKTLSAAAPPRRFVLR